MDEGGVNTLAGRLRVEQDELRATAGRASAALVRAEQAVGEDSARLADSIAYLRRLQSSGLVALADAAAALGTDVEASARAFTEVDLGVARAFVGGLFDAPAAAS